MIEFLKSTYFLDHENQLVRDFAVEAVGGATDAKAQAIRLFYAVRDGLRYDPYSVSMKRGDYRASVIATGGTAYCVPKAILMAAAGRAAGLPTRLGFADVRNHLATERLLDRLGTDVFAFHGFVEIFIDDRWLKVTPTFNKELCEKFGVLPLEFDGTSDALFQPFDAQGRRHMEYIRQRGSFADFPFDEMIRVYAEVYPGLDLGGYRAEDDASTW